MNDRDRTEMAEPLVHVVDDDRAVRESLILLFKSVRLEARGYPDADSFLEALDPARPGCLICDVRMPGLSGLQLQQRLNSQGTPTPVIFITGHGDVPMAVAAMREGAVDFLQKPLNEEHLLERVQLALENDRRRCRADRARHLVQGRFQALTEREREIMHHLIQGEANKVIASDLGISSRTVELHRARVLSKMRARNLTELLRIAETGGLAE